MRVQHTLFFYLMHRVHALLIPGSSQPQLPILVDTGMICSQQLADEPGLGCYTEPVVNGLASVTTAFSAHRGWDPECLYMVQDLRFTV